LHIHNICIYVAQKHNETIVVEFAGRLANTGLIGVTAWICRKCSCEKDPRFVSSCRLESMLGLAQAGQTALNGLASKLKPHAEGILAVKESLQDLDQFLSVQQQLENELAKIKSSVDNEEVSETRLLVQKRKQAISHLTTQLEEGVQGLRNLLDSCHALLETRPTTVEPESIIKYSYRLRFAYTPLGSTIGVPNEPPAPQPQFMLASNLNQFNLLQQQEQQKQLDLQRQQALRELQEQQRVMSLIRAHLPPDWLPGDPIPPEVLDIVMQAPPPEDTGAAAAAGATAAGTAAADQEQQSQHAAAGAGPPLLNLGPLNQDLEDIEGVSDWDDDDVLGDSASEEEDSED
jgi:hypothetical protein